MSDLSVRWIPTATVARMLGVSRQRVHRLVTLGRLRSVTLDGRIMVFRDSVDAYARERRLAGEARRVIG